MEIDYNDLIELAGADGHSLQLSIVTVGIDYSLGDSYTSRCVWSKDTNLNSIIHAIDEETIRVIRLRALPDINSLIQKPIHPNYYENFYNQAFKGIHERSYPARGANRIPREIPIRREDPHNPN